MNKDELRIRIIPEAGEILIDTNIFLKRLIIYRPLLYNEDGDEK